MSELSRLRADCARCCGLCCVAPTFYAEQGFGFDKAAHTACPNLQADHRCGIHDALPEQGFPACAAFDCFGAGQWVTRRFGGKSWRASPELAADMFKLYARYRVLHELLALLELALQRVPQVHATALEECRRQIEDTCLAGSNPAARVDLERLNKEARALVRHALRERLRAR
jgi:hypothetical protein